MLNMIKDDACIKAFSVSLHSHHQVRPLHTLGIARPVIHIRGRSQLAPLLDAGNNDRVEIRAGSIDSSSITGGSGAEDDEFMVLYSRHILRFPAELDFS